MADFPVCCANASILEMVAAARCTDVGYIRVKAGVLESAVVCR
jgi:hypothetical protein